MTRYDRRLRLLATALAGLAGFVDALGFLHFHGFFVSFMSGNSTRLGVGLATQPSTAAIAIGLIATFILGVVLGSLIGVRAGPRRRPAVLAFVASVLTVAALLGLIAVPTATAACMVLAMGSANAVFERDGEVTIGVTYMTGSLVKAGQRIAAALHGSNPLAWWPYLQLWLGLVLGAAAGAVAHGILGLGGLWIAAGAAGACCLAATVIDRKPNG